MTGALSRAMRGRFVLAEVIDEDACPDPHPELVLAQRPAVSDLIEAVAVIGFFPDGSYLAGQIRVSLLTLLPGQCEQLLVPAPNPGEPCAV